MALVLATWRGVSEIHTSNWQPYMHKHLFVLAILMLISHVGLQSRRFQEEEQRMSARRTEPRAISSASIPADRVAALRNASSQRLRSSALISFKLPAISTRH
jgi:hypothetical protein